MNDSVLRDENIIYGMSVDWWSLGVVLHEMIVGRLPFPQWDNHEDLYDSIIHDEVPEFPIRVSLRNLSQTEIIFIDKFNCKASCKIDDVMHVVIGTNRGRSLAFGTFEEDSSRTFGISRRRNRSDGSPILSVYRF